MVCTSKGVSAWGCDGYMLMDRNEIKSGCVSFANASGF